MSKSSHGITFAKHVYLRTQQRRLRHVKSVVVRNLTPQRFEAGLGDPLDIQTFFTVHPLYNVDKVLYKSEVISRTYNPSWESIQFTAPSFGKHSSLSRFSIRVWAEWSGGDRSRRGSLPGSPGSEPEMTVPDKEMVLAAGGGGGGGGAKLVFEKTLDLSDLEYLGTLVNKDGSSYPANSVVIGMFEGYYSDPVVGGVSPPPLIAHSLVDLLPPCSLLEVPKTEVQESYLSKVLQQILAQQEVLNATSVRAQGTKVKVQGYMEEKRGYFRKKEERESLKMRIALLQREIQQQEKLEKEESKKLAEQKETLDSFESKLRQKQRSLQEDTVKYQQNLDSHSQRVEALVSARKSLMLRQHNMVYELSQTFFIKEVREAKDTFTICNVILPNSDQLDQNSSNTDQFGVALGFAAHLVSHLARILLVPLQYPIKPHSSRSTISDHISEEAIIDTIKEFPLYLKGSEKALFLYAVHLLNKDVGQVRQHCGYGVSRSMQKKTLPNLKYLLDELIKDFFLMSTSPGMPAPLSRSPSHPIDAAFRYSGAAEGDPLRRDFSRISTFSSISSVATTAGLSLTPPTPLPGIAIHHENFHNMVGGGEVARQPVANNSGSAAAPTGPGEGDVDAKARDVVGVVKDGVGVVNTVEIGGGGDVQNGVGHFDVRGFRSRSGHVTGDYPAERRGSVRSSSHSSGGYPSNDVAAVAMQNPPSSNGHGHDLEGGCDEVVAVVGGEPQEAVVEKSSSHEKLHYEVSAGQENEELQGFAVVGSEQQRGGANNGNGQPTTRPVAQEQQQWQQQQQQQQQWQDGDHDMIHFGHANGAVRESSPAGAGLLGSTTTTTAAPYVGVAGGVATGEHGNEGEGGGGMGFFADAEERLTHLVDLNEEAEESSLDFPLMKRSSRLVDAGDMQSRRERAESREHNMEPGFPVATTAALGSSPSRWGRGLAGEQQQQQQQQQQQHSNNNVEAGCSVAAATLAATGTTTTTAAATPSEFTSSLSPSSISFTASGFSRLSQCSEDSSSNSGVGGSGIRSSTPTTGFSGNDNRDLLLLESGQIPQVFVKRPFSPPEGKGEGEGEASSSVAVLAGLDSRSASNVSDWSHSGVLMYRHSNPPPLTSPPSSTEAQVNATSSSSSSSPSPFSSNTVAPPPSTTTTTTTTTTVEVLATTTTASTTAAGATPPSNNASDIPAMAQLNRGGKEVDIKASASTRAPLANSTPSSPHLPHEGERPPPAKNSAHSPPPSPPEAHRERACSMGGPQELQLPFSAFPHTPQLLHKSALSTPHVLGMGGGGGGGRGGQGVGPHPLQTLVQRSNHTQPETASSRANNLEGGSTEFLEDFIDGF